MLAQKENLHGYTFISQVTKPPHKKISEILLLHSGIIVVVSNK